MTVLGRKALNEACRKFPHLHEAVNSWEKIIAGIWPQHLPELRKTFPTADLVGRRKEYTCFNIKGNTFRLITVITYPDLILCREILKHDDYVRKYRV